MRTVQPIRSQLKIEEMRRELRKKSKRNEFLFIFGINSGLRISDILPLRVKDVKGKSFILIKEIKTKKNRKVILLKQLQLAIEEYCKDMKPSEFLFKSIKTNRPISRVQAYRILSDAAKEVGLEEIGSHSLRKSFGYWFYKSTKDVAILQEIFGHSSPSITMRYIGINDDNIEQAYEKFGGIF